MASKAVEWALDQHKVRGLDKLVLVVLGSEARDRDLLCWPTHRTIADRAGMSLSGVRESLGRLQQMKLLELVEDQHDITVYRVMAKGGE